MESTSIAWVFTVTIGGFRPFIDEVDVSIVSIVMPSTFSKREDATSGGGDNGRNSEGMELNTVCELICLGYIGAAKEGKSFVVRCCILGRVIDVC